MVVADESCEGRQDQTQLLKKFILPALLSRAGDTIRLSFFFFPKEKRGGERQEVKTQLEILLFFLPQLNTRLIIAGMETFVIFTRKTSAFPHVCELALLLILSKSRFL